MSEVVAARWRGGRRLGTVMLAPAAAGVIQVPTAASAWGDRYEASVHAHAIGGVAVGGDPAALPSEAVTLAPLAGIGVRASYTRSNWFQYDAQLTLATTAAAAFARGRFVFDDEPVTAPFTVTTRLARFDAGVTWRFGVQVIPTLRLAAGVTQRWRGAPTVRFAGADRDDADGRGAETATDPTGVAALGVDVRLSERLVVGGSIGGSIALPLDDRRWLTVEASVHTSYYWYPLWID